MQLESCDLCDHDQFEEIAQQDRHGQPLSTVACQNCGLVRHAEVPTELELQQFYSSGYREAYNGERTPGSRRIMRAWKNGERICQQIADQLPTGGRVLEVGAGIGCTVKVFDRNGFDAHGIDPGGEFLSFSRDSLNAQVQVASLYDLPKDQSHDAVLLVHVIEHLRSPKESLEHIAGLLKPGGSFYVECPNLQAPFARRSQLFHTAHIHNFVPSTLKMLAESCGFTLKQRFGDDRNPNLQMLFERTGTADLTVDESNYQRTLKDLKRADVVAYTLRPRYVTDRIAKVLTYGREHLSSRQFVEQLIADCKSAPSRPETQTARAA